MTNLKFFDERAKKLDLLHKLKKAQGAGPSVARVQKRSSDVMESMLSKKHQECMKLRKLESNHKGMIKDLEMQLADEKVQVVLSH